MGVRDLERRWGAGEPGSRTRHKERSAGERAARLENELGEEEETRQRGALRGRSSVGSELRER
jgi:hypothetical protein